MRRRDDFVIDHQRLGYLNADAAAAGIDVAAECLPASEVGTSRP